MFSLILFTVFVIASTEGAVPKSPSSISFNNGRIIGGEDAKIEDYPYMAGLEEGGIFCGATIITSRHVITAAHCLGNFPNVEGLLVRVGTAIRDTGGQAARVKKYTLHPKYTHESADYDIAVVELKDSFIFGPRVQAIPLQERDQEPAVGSFANVTGWGYTSTDDLPLILQVVEVPRVSHKICRDIFGITSRMICYGFEQGGKDSCGGDSGGPLVSNGKLAGVVSAGGECAAPRQPGIYTNIANEEIYDFVINSIN